ncbi:tetratricopeptide repeat protein [Kiloniella laminariae]|uniref:Tetratricopeptide repeat protein n=1 Tax=Kiloniella laminariae TaxID=454162 RepID=A0ABT4LLK7_9PROT|nr:tetratricopeptide repeat protein [Kiloniella laminariae]MCZ4281989.1 tetratricopeptide repeat protein [Kiloniella laminariae]
MKQALLGIASACGIILFTFSSAMSDEYLKGVGAYESGDLSAATAYWLPLAEAGDARAQYSLGKLFETEGADVTPHYQEAIHWYQKAADQNVVAALNNLGRLYAQGKGLAPSQEKAVEYWQKAAQADHAMAQYNLGLAYLRGEGVPRNLTQAVFWFHQSANGNESGAQFALGEVYRLGITVPPDQKQAEKWYQLALESGDSRAKQMLDRLALVDKIKPKEKNLPALQDGGEKLTVLQRESETTVSVAGADTALDDAAAKVLSGSPAVSPGHSTASDQPAMTITEKMAGEQEIASLDEMAPIPLRNPRRYGGNDRDVAAKPKPNPRR